MCSCCRLCRFAVFMCTENATPCSCPLYRRAHNFVDCISTFKSRASRTVKELTTIEQHISPNSPNHDVVSRGTWIRWSSRDSCNERCIATRRWRRHGTWISESRDTNAWVILHAWMSHETNEKGSRDHRDARSSHKTQVLQQTFKPNSISPYSGVVNMNHKNRSTCG